MKLEIVILVLVLVAVAFVAGLALQQRTSSYSTTQSYNPYSAPPSGQGVQNYPTPRPIAGGGGCGV